MKRKERLLLVLGVAILALAAAPANATLFDFHAGSLQSTFTSRGATTGDFSVSPLPTAYSTVINVVRPGGESGAIVKCCG